MGTGKSVADVDKVLPLLTRLQSLTGIQFEYASSSDEHNAECGVQVVFASSLLDKRELNGHTYVLKKETNFYTRLLVQGVRGGRNPAHYMQ